jgi:hypothetical protein
MLLVVLVVLLLGDGFGCARAAVDTGGLSRAAFPKGFVFGTATSAFQVEGMATGGGRGPSIWDPFVHTPGTQAHHQLIELVDPTQCCYRSAQIVGGAGDARDGGERAAGNRVSRSLRIS